MHKLSQEQVNMINLLAQLDSQAINHAFSISNNLGLGQLSSSITDYSNFLKKKYGEIVLSYCGEYRIYIIKLLEKIDDEFKSEAMSELISPKVKQMTGVEFLEIIQEAAIIKVTEKEQ
mgnify:FL=1